MSALPNMNQGVVVTNNPVPLSIKPQDAREEKALRIMMTQDPPAFIPSHGPILRWRDMLPLHYLFVQILGLCIVALLLNLNVGLLLLIHSGISLPLLIYAIHKVSTYEDSIFELRLVLPHKLSCTSVIVNDGLIPLYRFWSRVQFALIEAYCLAFVTYLFI